MILPYQGTWPEIHETAFIAPSADVLGRVKIGRDSSVWFQTVIRGDVNTIQIGARTNIQDHSTLHVTRREHPLVIGDEVTGGHRIMLHGCTIGNRVLIGMNATVMDGAVVEDDCVIAAGALVTEGKRIPSGSLAMGVPAKVVRVLTEEERGFLKKSADNYVKDGQEYKSQVRGPKRLGADDGDLESLDIDVGDTESEM